MFIVTCMKPSLTNFNPEQGIDLRFIVRVKLGGREAIMLTHFQLSYEVATSLFFVSLNVCAFTQAF